MPEAKPGCCGGWTTQARESPATTPPPVRSMSTSVYETRLGFAALSWSRAPSGGGLSLRLELQIQHGDLSGAAPRNPLRFQIWPSLFWNRRGVRRFDLSGRRRSVVELSWDLSRAKFAPGGGPEPSSSFSVSVSVDGDAVLVVGDLAAPPEAQALISRREHVILAGENEIGAEEKGNRRIAYRTATRFGGGGRDREISIEVAGSRDSELGMSVAVDGKGVLQVRRVIWKFRGSERVDVGGGEWIRISWDLHGWLFPFSAGSRRPPPPRFAIAVFVFRFERVEFADDDEDDGAGGDDEDGMPWSCSPAEWVSTEESQLLSAAGFSLVVCAGKRC